MTSNMDVKPHKTTPDAAKPASRRWIWGLILIGLLAVLYVMFGDSLSIDRLVAWEGELRSFQRNRPFLTYLAAFALYVAVAALSLPGATGLTLLYGWLFGLAEGVILVSFASTIGAGLAFLVSRYLFRDAMRARFGQRAQRFEAMLERQGAYYLFTLRLIPVVPFFVVNAVMGLTPIRLWTFLWVSQIGMLPGTAVYVYAGSNVPSLAEFGTEGISSLLSIELVISFILLGLFPLVVKLIFDWLKPSRATTIGSPGGENNA